MAPLTENGERGARELDVQIVRVLQQQFPLVQMAGLAAGANDDAPEPNAEFEVCQWSERSSPRSYRSAPLQQRLGVLFPEKGRDVGVDDIDEVDPAKKVVARTK